MEKDAKKLKKPTIEAFLDEISCRAEEIYKKRIASNKPGDQMSDWLQAEKEIKKKHNL
jgi:hypothetical protein